MSKSTALPAVSVVIPAYYPGPIFNEALASIFNLDYPKNLIEVLVVSVPTDNTVHDLVRQFISETGLNVKLLIVDSNVASVRRNHGIRNSKYNIVLVSDDDIILHKETLTRSIEIISHDGKVAAVAYAVVGDRQGFVDRLYHMKFINARLQNISTATACTIFNKKILEEVGLYREDMGPPLGIHEDWELGSRIRKKGFKLLIDGSIYSTHLYASRPSAPNRTNQAISPKKNLFTSYAVGARRNYKTFFAVMRSSAFSQRLEYSIYFLIPIAILSLLLFSLLYSVLFLGVTLGAIESNSLIEQHYKIFKIRYRLLYPLATVFVRIVRVYLSALFFVIH
ncbi:MAG: glycosyltransferase [Nitrososphaerota archaeon]|nr:glycosyltransferase [Nitrososphaerota archaeon]